MPEQTRVDRRVIGAIATLAIGVVGAVVTRSLENTPGWISTAFLIIAGVAAADLAVEAYYRPRFAALSRTIEPNSSAAEAGDAVHARSRLAKQRDVALVVSVLAGGTLGMIVGIVLNGALI